MINKYIKKLSITFLFLISFFIICGCFACNQFYSEKQKGYISISLNEETPLLKTILPEENPYQNMLDSTMLSSIGEWAPTDLNNFRHYPYLLLVSITLSLAIIKRKILNNKQVRLIYIILVLLMVVWVIVRNLTIWKEYVITKLSL